MASFRHVFFRSVLLAGGRRLSSGQYPRVFSTPLTGTKEHQCVSHWFPRPAIWPRFGSRRHYAASNGKESDGEGESEGGQGEEKEGEQTDSDGEGSDSTAEGEGELGGLEMLPVARHHAIAPVNIPDNFPEVPILPISRNPLFPRFVKMLEVSQSDEMSQSDETLCVLSETPP